MAKAGQADEDRQQATLPPRHGGYRAAPVEQAETGRSNREPPKPPPGKGGGSPKGGPNE